jgi:hypothetical protein
MTTFLRNHLVAAIVSVAALTMVGGGAVAYAVAAPQPTTSPATATTTAPPAPTAGSAAGSCSKTTKAAKSCRRGGAKGAKRAGTALLARAVHGELTVKTPKGFESLTFDRGTATSTTGSTITLNRADGVAVRIAVDGATRYAGVTDLSGVTAGKPALVLSHLGVATLVAQRRAATPDGAPASTPAAAPAAAPASAPTSTALPTQ